VATQQQIMRNRGLLGIVAIVVVILVITHHSGGPSKSAKVTGKVVQLVALDSNTVRIYLTWTNSGLATGSATCVLNTNVSNQFGDNVNIEVNSTSSNGNIAPGHSRNLYQDIGVNAGDANYVKASDVSIKNC
jgi:hypothetical protein